MKIRVVKDATLTVKAGQLVEVDDRQAALAFKLGCAEPAKEEPAEKPAEPKKTTTRKKKG